MNVHFVNILRIFAPEKLFKFNDDKTDKK
jgi:hypothetical protein